MNVRSFFQWDKNDKEVDDMKFWKKLVSGILSAAMVLSASIGTVSAASESEYTVKDGYTFSRAGSAIDYPRGQTDLVLPSASPNQFYLMSVNLDLAFDSTVRSITIPDTSHKQGAVPTSISLKIYGCPNLEEINFPSTVRYFFVQITDCPKLKTIRVPNGVHELPSGFLYSCFGLEKVYIPASVTKMYHTRIHTRPAGSQEPPETFLDLPNATFIVEEGSYADQWFKEESQFRCRRVSSSKSGWVQNTSGQWQYYQNGTALTGWQKINGLWYYMDSNTYMHKSWLKQGNDWYYCHYLDGYMMTGWIRIGGLWYYLNDSGVMQTGWQRIGGSWYYLNSNGAMFTGWQNLNGVWYYLDGSGAMKTGWQYLGGKWYYLNASGAMQTGWQLINGKWYYLESSGAMHKSWLKDGNDWYYCHYLDGYMMTGWIRIGGKWYYQDNSGRMLANTTTPDGYHVGSDGAMI